MMAFVFGLIYGFGFASVLTDLGLSQDALFLALIGFNLGVETGQLAIVAAFFSGRNLHCGMAGCIAERSCWVAQS